MPLPVLEVVLNATSASYSHQLVGKLFIGICLGQITNLRRRKLHYPASSKIASSLVKYELGTFCLEAGKCFAQLCTRHTVPCSCARSDSRCAESTIVLTATKGD